VQYCVRGERWWRPCDRLRPTSKECSHLSEQEACRPVVPPWPRRTRGPSSHRRDAGRGALCALVDGRPPFTPCISSRHAVGVLPFREARPRAVVQESGRVAPHHPLAKVPPSTHNPQCLKEGEGTSRPPMTPEVQFTRPTLWAYQHVFAARTSLVAPSTAQSVASAAVSGTL
jgi:hypothetical protein